MQLDPLTQRRGLIVQLSHVEPQGFDRGYGEYLTTQEAYAEGSAARAHDSHPEDDEVARFFVAGMAKADEEGLNLFAQAPVRVPCRSATPSRRNRVVPKDYGSERPQWNSSTVPKPWSLEGFKAKRTPLAAWALNEDRRSLETGAAASCARDEQRIGALHPA